jgi:hypothetical protein
MLSLGIVVIFVKFKTSDRNLLQYKINKILGFMIQEYKERYLFWEILKIFILKFMILIVI